MDDSAPDQPQRERYQRERALGAGGMGVVYLARDTILHRQVAIKKLRRDAASASAQRRIQQEARLLARLNHSNIVRLYDIVEERDGIALVMEYVEGCTLRQWMLERQPSLEEKLRVLAQVCKGLQQAHALGIIHRDLKPDNILITGGGAPTAKITDFGIAKHWREDSDLTREQHIVGSWGIMSPEQAQGKPLDNRSDLFTLGTLAYQLLCGQNPFGDCDSLHATMERIVHHPHPPAARLNPQLPQALCKLLDRLMAKDPKHRPCNAAEVSAALDDIVIRLGNRKTAGQGINRGLNSGQSATITVETFHRQKIGKRIHKKKLYTAARASMLAVAAIAILATAAFHYLPGPPREKDEKYIALILPEVRESSREVSILHNNVLNAIREGLSNRKGLYLVPTSESEALRDKPLRYIASALNVQLLLNPEISCGQNFCDLSLELIDSQNLSVIANRDVALSLDSNLGGYEKTRQQINYLLPDYPLRHPRPELQISEADYQRYLELEALHYDGQQNAEILQALEELQQRAPFFAPVYELYSLCVFQARFQSVDLDAVDRLEKLLARAPVEIADSLEFISAKLNLAETQYDWAETDRQLERLRTTFPDAAHYYHRKAINYHLRGEYQKELQFAERALAHRTSTNYLVQKAIALSHLGDMEGARPVLRQALEIDSELLDAISLLAANELDMGHTGETIRLLGTVSPDRLGSVDFYNLCMAHFLEKHYRQADQCFGELYTAQPSDLEPLLYRAEIAGELGQPQEARQLSERALELSLQREGWENRLVQAMAYAQLGQPEHAAASLLEIRQQAPDDLYVNQARAQVYIAIDDLASAEAHIRKTLELGQSPVWYHSARFAKICSHEVFADLRDDRPELCIQKQ